MDLHDDDDCERMTPSRRAVLGAAGALFAWSFVPKLAYAAPGSRDPRFLVVVLRGALDGLSAVPPLGDPAYQSLREGIALSKDGPDAALPLDGFFYLHPAMPNLARLYRNGQAAIVHAAATGYRERSHFDGQDVLESGQPGPGHTATGWLNRLLASLPAGEGIARKGVLGVGVVPPLVVRGEAPVLGWAPPRMARAGADLTMRLADSTASAIRASPLRCSRRSRPQRWRSGAAWTASLPAGADRTASMACAGSPRARPDSSAPMTARASPHWPSKAGTPMRTRAAPRACWPRG